MHKILFIDRISKLLGLEAIASRLEAVASRLEAFAIRLEAIAPIAAVPESCGKAEKWRPSLLYSNSNKFKSSQMLTRPQAHSQILWLALRDIGLVLTLGGFTRKV